MLLFTLPVSCPVSRKTILTCPMYSFPSISHFVDIALVTSLANQSQSPSISKAQAYRFVFCFLPTQWKFQWKAHLPQSVLGHGFLEGCLAQYRFSINIWECKGLWNPIQTTSSLSQTTSCFTFQHHQQSLSLCLSTSVFSSRKECFPVA